MKTTKSSRAPTPRAGLRWALPLPPNFVRPPAPCRRAVQRGSGVIAITLSLAVLLGCSRSELIEKSKSLATDFRLIDRPPARPVIVDLCLDVSAGSPTDQAVLGRTLELVQTTTPDQGSMLVRVWLFAAEPTNTTKIASAELRFDQAESGSKQRARRRAFESAIAAIAARSLPSGEKPLASPIIESMAVVTFDDSGLRDAERRLIVLTDGKEFYRGLDFECSPPMLDVFLCVLRTFSGISTGSFAGIDVTLIGVRPIPNDRDDCPMTLGRHREITVLWNSALQATGARSVEIYQDVPATLSYREEGSR